MSDDDSEDDVFGDELGLDERFTAHSGTGGAQTQAIAPGPVVISAMYRSGLLGDATMQQVQKLYELTCVESKLGWYVAHDTIQHAVAACQQCYLCVIQGGMLRVGGRRAHGGGAGRGVEAVRVIENLPPRALAHHK